MINEQQLAPMLERVIKIRRSRADRRRGGYFRLQAVTRWAEEASTDAARRKQNRAIVAGGDDNMVISPAV